MPEFPIRKIAVLTEEIVHDGGPVVNVPRRRAAAMALVKNPFAGRYVEELQSAMEDLKPLGLILTDRLIALLSACFGLLATLLASIGLYGVMAFVIARRRK